MRAGVVAKVNAPQILGVAAQSSGNGGRNLETDMENGFILDYFVGEISKVPHIHIR